MEDQNVMAPFWCWQFLLTALAINALLAYARRFVREANPATLERRWWKALMTLANPVLGFLAAITPGFLYGDTLAIRALVGMCAGFLSHFVYSLVIKRFTEHQPRAPQGPAPEDEEIP